MILSRQRPALSAATGLKEKESVRKQPKIPELEEFLDNRDYTGAITLLEFNKNANKAHKDADMWIGYCAFHLGDYKKALEVYSALTSKANYHKDALLNFACVCFYLGMYKESEEACKQVDKSPLQNRLLFHLSHKFNDEKQLLSYHQYLQDQFEDQMCLASIHYMRSHYQEAIDIYKRILLENRLFLALNVYVALCYYKLDYYDVSQEVLAVYLQSYPDSAIAVNLKACNHYKLYNGKAAEAELKHLRDVSTSGSTSFGSELIKHNLVVFRGGEGALQALPPLIDVIPEARLNLVIYYLRQDDLQEAYSLIKDHEPTGPSEYVIKAVVNAALGQNEGSREHLDRKSVV